jgi:hypothetical protein
MQTHDQYSFDKKIDTSTSAASHQFKQSSSGTNLVDNRAASVVQRKPNNTGLPDQLKSGIENLSGYSLDDVKVHYNSVKPAQLNAYAYAQGTDIHVASGQEKHLPHEAWHVVQQKQGRVQATRQMKSNVSINDDKGLEKEADIKGAASLRQRFAKSPVQRVRRPVPGHVAQLVGPGDPAPSTQSRLTNRYRQMSTDAGITDKLILDRALQLMAAGFVPPAPLAHPLQQLTAPQVVAFGLQSRLAEDNSAVANVGDFKIFVSNSCLDLAMRNINVLPELNNAINEAVDPWVSDAIRDLHISAVTNSNAELRAAIAATTPGGNQLDKAATAHLATRPAMAELTAQQRTQLSQQLHTMPVVQSMLAGTLANHGDGAAHLLTGVSTTGGAAQTQQFTDRLLQGLTILGGLVHAAVLPPAARVPNVEINPDVQVPIPQTLVERLRGIQRTYTRVFRANASRENNRVRLSALTEMDTVVHEFGHQIEFNLPTAQWLDIQELLRMRHAGGGLVSIHPQSPDADERREAAYNANMPATGLYSARVYDDDSTEVMSMTLEYFSTPANAARMIDNDPLQAAIILRIIQPAEFNRHIAANLRALLPRGDIAPAHAPGAPAPVIQGHQQGIFDAVSNDDL